MSQGPLLSLQHKPQATTMPMGPHPPTHLSSKAMLRDSAWPSSSLHSSICSRCHFNSGTISNTGTLSNPLPLDSWVPHPLLTTNPSCLPAQPWDPQQGGNSMGSSSPNRSLARQLTFSGVEVGVAEAAAHDLYTHLSAAMSCRNHNIFAF